MEKRVIVANVNNLIALCHILNKYPDFMVNLEEFMASKNSRGLVESLEEISHGNKSGIGTKKVRNFYNENYDVIDKINKYSSISSFINSCFDYNGNLRENGELNFFYNYFLNNQDNLNAIYYNLLKISDLGFNKLGFDATEDFTKEEYRISTCFSLNTFIEYLDNIEIVLSYRPDVVLYKTSDSDYKITTNVSTGELTDTSIVVNNLVFDVKRLPDSINREILYDNIIKMREEKKEVFDDIRDSVNLGVAVDDLYCQYDSLCEVVEKLKNASCNEELTNVLIELENSLKKIKKVSSKFDEGIVEKNSDVTKEQLVKEKELYLSIRYYNRLDLD